MRLRLNCWFDYLRKVANMRAANDNSPTRQQHICKHCNEPFMPKESNRITFCSRACSYAHATALARARPPKPPAPKPPEIIRQCIICANDFIARTSIHQCCSDECRKEQARQFSLAAANDNHKPIERACRECGTVFVPAYGSKRRVYCCNECLKKSARRSAKQRRRARIRASVIEPVYAFDVFERDHWQCQICGVDTPRALRGTNHSHAPELDHVVPLAKGGAHTYANTQCACRRCNADKSDTLPPGLEAA